MSNQHCRHVVIFRSNGGQAGLNQCLLRKELFVFLKVVNGFKFPVTIKALYNEMTVFTSYLHIIKYNFLRNLICVYIIEN